MAETETPQIYLISPPDFDLSDFPARLASVLDARDDTVTADHVDT